MNYINKDRFFEANKFIKKEHFRGSRKTVLDDNYTKPWLQTRNIFDQVQVRVRPFFYRAQASLKS